MRLECLAKLSWIFYYSRPTLVSAGLEKNIKTSKENDDGLQEVKEKVKF